jgi:diguanylate cyclase (GGDEF)-like protein
MSNRGWGKSARDFVTRCPIADSSTPLDQMLAIYSSAEDAPGIIITSNGSYSGFLSTPSIIRAIHERTLARAQDENPLTRLPGNALIGEYLVERISADAGSTIAYLDFDNFKPFNDIYGFRQGDRAIMLFAQLLRESENQHSCFIGHIGGDDFFIGIHKNDEVDPVEIIKTLISTFSDDALSFYDAETRTQGYITGLDRDGNTKQFPLLSASAVIVTLPSGHKGFTVDDISATIASYKKQSKSSPNRIAIAPLVIPRLSSLTLSPKPSQTE